MFRTDYNREALDGTSTIKAKEGHVNWIAFRADMTASEQVKVAVDQCLERYGRIDVLVNNWR